MRIVYTSSERFMNEMITCIKSDRMPAFHRYYRSADVLLIDDIQILAGKERTQEEFFHTFNELYEHQKQIVVSSDSTPKSTPGLVDRLRSRFEWGLMVDIQPPDLETKMAILDKKAERRESICRKTCASYIATKTKSNVRELEGALVKLMAYSSVTGHRSTLAMAQQVLKHLIPGQEKRVTMDVGSARGGRAVPTAAQPTEAEDEHPKDCVSAADCHVPDQGADAILTARDRPNVRRQAPHHCAPLHP